MAVEGILSHFSEALQRIAINQERLHKEQMQTKQGAWMVGKKLESMELNLKEMMKEQRVMLEDIRNPLNELQVMIF